jgi:ATP-dependent Clp protease adapter protein ClpS
MKLYTYTVKYKNPFLFTNSTDSKVSKEIYNNNKPMSKSTLKSKKLILHNDQFTGIETVIFALIHILGYNDIQAQQITLITHQKGKCVIKTGKLKDLKIYQKKLKDIGLKITIED